MWDAFVRLFHWSVAVGFFVAYFTEDGPLTLHVWAGYVVGVLVVLRIVWGFIGPEHARFSSFIFPPGTVLRYLWDLLLGRAKRYLGHSPGGGAMVLVLLIGLARDGRDRLGTVCHRRERRAVGSARELPITARAGTTGLRTQKR